MPTLPQVKVRRSFPLTSIEKIEYEPDSKEPGPRVFKLLFPTDIMMLQAETIEDAKDWVEKIREGGFGMILTAAIPQYIFLCSIHFLSSIMKLGFV